MATFAIQRISYAGLTPAYSAVSASDRGPVGTAVFYHIKNAGGSADSVVIDDVTSPSPAGATAFNPDVTVSVPNGGERMIGPITDRFAQADGLGATITNSFTTSVTMGAFTT